MTNRRPSAQPTKREVKASRKQAFRVKPVYGYEVAAAILDNLSKEHSDVCNYHVAVGLCRQGETYLALLAVQDANEGIAETSPRHVWVKAQAMAALKKLEDPQVDRWASTKTTWFATEERCRKLNIKFEALLGRRSRGVKPVPRKRELYRVYEFVSHVLGAVPPLEEILQAAHYGPGSSVSVRGRSVHYVRKVGAYECVPLAVELAASSLVYDKASWAHVGMDPVYATNPDAQAGFRRVMTEALRAHVVQHDALMFIHKNITSLRSIGAQPTCSGMLQLGVHTVVTEFLKKVNIFLGDQGRNQRLAYIGSRDSDDKDPICTLDKSNASNLLAKGIVQSFFPPAWAKLLMRIRTPGYQAPLEIGGGEHVYHMYAGMGNGTTFVVETLVFAAMAFATSDAATVEEFVQSVTFAIYGDDVILRRAHALRYMDLAEWMGFRFNEEKTFLTGKFRESCGADYFAGVNVRPAYVKATGKDGSLHELEMIGVHNTLADHPTWPLKGACKDIRRLWSQRMYPVVPTDPQGNLGFRPVDCAYYDIVKDSKGPQLSLSWQRPREYVMEVRPRFEGLGELDPWTQIAVALMRARQSGNDHGALWSLPLRDMVNTRITAEKDLVRGDLVQMLSNTLARLAMRKQQPWFETSRGRG